MLPCCMSMIDDESDRLNFEKIYDLYADDVFKRICRLVKNRQDAEDIMQDVWLTVAQNIEFYRGKEDHSVRAYLLRIAKYRSIDFYHANEKEKDRMCEAEQLERLFGGDDETLLFQLCARMDVVIIRQCIESLDEIYSDVLNCYYLHDCTVREIAKMLKLKEVTVRARLARGRARLLQTLEGRNLNER